MKIWAVAQITKLISSPYLPGLTEEPRQSQAHWRCWANCTCKVSALAKFCWSLTCLRWQHGQQTAVTTICRLGDIGWWGLLNVATWSHRTVRLDGTRAFLSGLCTSHAQEGGFWVWAWWSVVISEPPTPWKRCHESLTIHRQIFPSPRRKSESWLRILKI